MIPTCRGECSSVKDGQIRENKIQELLNITEFNRREANLFLPSFPYVRLWNWYNTHRHQCWAHDNDIINAHTPNLEFKFPSKEAFNFCPMRLRLEKGTIFKFHRLGPRRWCTRGLGGGWVLANYNATGERQSSAEILHANAGWWTKETEKKIKVSTYVNSGRERQ